MTLQASSSGESTAPRFIATYAPEAWVNDYATAVDVDGPNTWDCTDYLATAGAYGARLIDKLQSSYSVIDTDDVLADDPQAPELVRAHRGPFTITVRLVEGHPTASQPDTQDATGAAEFGVPGPTRRARTIRAVTTPAAGADD